MTTRVAVCGAAGRMGKAILQVCAKTEDVLVTAAIEHPSSPQLGSDSGEVAGIEKNNVSIVADITTVFTDFDVAIDFTLPGATINTLEQCKITGKAMVISSQP